MYDKICKDRFDRMEKKMDIMLEKQDDLKDSIEPKVNRNTLIINGILWVVAVVVIAYVGSLFV